MNNLITSDIINSKIYSIRGYQVMLDRDLAELYGVDTKRLNERVKRNIDRFSDDFMFQLTFFEVESLRSQIATLKNFTRGEHSKYLPYVFTEQGVAMLSGILKSKVAIDINLEIMRTFVSLRKLINNNSNILIRLDNVEEKQFKSQLENNSKFDKIFNLLEDKNNLKQNQGIFFDGQLFDSYYFVCDLIRSAKGKIVLIDNYIDDSILTLFSKRANNVEVIIYTKKINFNLKQDLEKYNSQYDPIKIKEFKLSHDRFLIIDYEVYHIGASLKDLGKKWFAFSKLDVKSFDLLSKIK